MEKGERSENHRSSDSNIDGTGKQVTLGVPSVGFEETFFRVDGADQFSTMLGWQLYCQPELPVYPGGGSTTATPTNIII